MVGRSWWSGSSGRACLASDRQALGWITNAEKLEGTTQCGPLFPACALSCSLLHSHWTSFLSTCQDHSSFKGLKRKRNKT